MVVGFLSIDATSLIVVLAIYFLFVHLVGSYGRNTALGYWGSVLVAVFTTPVTAFVVITILRLVNSGRR